MIEPVIEPGHLWDPYYPTLLLANGVTVKLRAGWGINKDGTITIWPEGTAGGVVTLSPSAWLAVADGKRDA